MIDGLENPSLFGATMKHVVHSLSKLKCDFKRDDVMMLIRIIANCANKHRFHLMLYTFVVKTTKLLMHCLDLILGSFKKIVILLWTLQKQYVFGALDFILNKCFN